MSVRERRAAVERVEWAEVVLPLSPAILLGSIRVPERRYAWVSVHSADGMTGGALAFTRNLPLVELLPGMASLAVAADGRVADFNRRVDDVYGLAGPNGVVARARSLVDLALWDLHGHATGEPVWRLVGSDQAETPVIGVAGYGREGVDEDLPAELLAWAESGCAAVKIELGGQPDAGRDGERVLGAMLAGGGPGVPTWIDVNGAWAPGSRTEQVVGRLEDAGVALVEEPYSTRTSMEELRALTRSTGTDVAMGEFDHDPRIFDAYAGADVQVCRADATLVGGVDAWLAVARRWVARGRPVFPHFYPEYHLQLAGAVTPALGVELVPEWTVRLDDLRHWPAPRRGDRIACPDAPGFGVTWDRAAIDAHAERRGTVTAR